MNQLLGPLDEDQYQDPTSRLLLALWHGNEDVIQIVEEEVCRPLDSINKGAIYSGVGGVNPYSAGIDFSHQNLTSKVDPRTVRVKIFLMAVDPEHRYLKKSERANIYDDLKLKKPFSLHGLNNNISAL